VSDLSGTPGFVLAFLTLFYLMLLLGYVFKEQSKGGSAFPRINVTGHSLPVWVFGVACLCLLFIFGLAFATVRAFYLSQKGLLQSDKHLVFKSFGVPYLLAIGTEIAVVLSGLLLFGITKSKLLLILAFFLPLIGVLGMRALSQWLKNDFELLEHPALRPKLSLTKIAAMRAAANDAAKRVQSRRLKQEKADVSDEVSLVSPDQRLDVGDPSTAGIGPAGAANTAFRLPPMQKAATATSPVVYKEPNPPGAVEEQAGEAKPDEFSPDGVPPADAATAVVASPGGPSADGTGDVTTVAMDAVEPKPPSTPFKDRFMTWAERYAIWKASAVDPVDMPPLQAFVRGYLTRADYATLACVFGFGFFVFLMGLVIGGTVSPGYLGHAIWVGTFVLITSLLPIIKYFHTYTFTFAMYATLFASALVFTIACFVFYGVTLHGSKTNPGGLWLLTIWLLYPALLTLCSAAYMWKEEGFYTNKFIRVGTALSALPILLWIVVVFGLDGSHAGGIVFLIVLIAVVLVFGTHVWAENDYYLPHSFMVGINVFLFFMAGLFIFIGLVSSVDIFWCFSIAMFFLALRQLGLAVQLWANRNPEAVMFYSPFVFPMYSYQPDTYDVVSENRFGALICSVLGLWLLWGLFAISFVKLLPIGVGILSLVLVVTVQLVAYVVSSTPLRLGQASLFADEWVLKQAGDIARAAFLRRREVLDVLCDEFLQRDAREEELLAKADKFGQKKRAAEAAAAAKQSSLLERFTAVEVAENIVRLETDLTMSMPEDTRQPPPVAAAPLEDMVTPPSKWQKLKAGCAGCCTRARGVGKKLPDLAAKHFPEWSRHWTYRPPSVAVDLVRRHDAPYTLHDVLEDIWYTGDGPLGWLSARGWFYMGRIRYRKWKAAKERQRKYEAALEEAENASATKAQVKAAKAAKAQAEGIELVQEEGEEADAKATPRSPPGPASPGSPGSVDDSMGSPLSPESQMDRKLEVLAAAAAAEPEEAPKVPGLGVLEDIDAGVPYMGEPRDVFGMLPKCLDPATVYEQILDMYDELAREYYEENRVLVHLQLMVIVSAEARLRSEGVLFQKFLREYRFKLMANGVQPPEHVFQTQSYASVDVQLVATWLMRLSAEQRERFKSLKDRFSEEVEAQYYLRLQADQEAAAASMQHVLSLRPHEQYMWQKRWQDFQKRRIARKKAGLDNPNVAEDDLNNQEIVNEIEEKKEFCKPGEYGRDMQFHDPAFPHDETSVGHILRPDVVTGWRVSKEMNPNASLFADGTDPDDVFQGQLSDGWLLSAISIVAASGGVGDDSVDPLIDNLFVTKETTSTGVYAVRLFKNSQWETVVVDDFFPVSGSGEGTVNSGAAFAYSKGFKELWVPLLEKAYAKYHGGYAALEYGYVHHALHDLTGGDAEEVFLAEASRGANKYQLWTNLVKYRANHYLLGAGTVMPNTTDRELMDSGLVFGAAYVIYDVRFVDGLRLLKLRNPPGDHGEWKGDWGDKSPLWTRRMKVKLGWSDEDDGTFWMSFDDFCFAFRSLYLCKWFDPAKWFKDTHSGWWKGPTAEGLPSKHNIGCKVQNNPQFQLIVRRPTDLCVVLNQSIPDFALNNQPHPIACYVVKDPGPPPADGVRLPKQRRIFRLNESELVGERDVVTGKLLLGPYADAEPDPLAATAGSVTAATSKQQKLTQEAQRKAILTGLGRETGLSADFTAVAAKRVVALTNTNVVVSSGNPIRQREIRTYATLPPGAYTILVACYQKLMEGPFTLTVYSNYRVHSSGLWPPAPTATPAPLSRVGKLINNAKAYGHALRDRVLRRTDDHEAALAKLEEERDAVAALAAMKEAALEAEAASATMKAKPITAWMEQWDPVQQMAYYVNVETGESQWDMPLELKPGMEGVAEFKKAMSDKALEKKAPSPSKPKKRTRPMCHICNAETVKGTAEPSIANWCAPGRTPSDLLKCARGCGAFTHPVCAGFSDSKPPPDVWICPVCKDEDADE